MKITQFSKSLHGITVAFMTILCACSSHTQFSSLRPADITLPKHIRSIVLIDRSKPARGFNNVIEGILTGESIGQDRLGRKEVIHGMFNTLASSPKYKVIPTGIELEGSKSGEQMAQPLDHEILKEIAERYNADAVLSIESYDSDQFIKYHTKSQKHKDSDGNENITNSYTANRIVNIKLGYRLYDVQGARILDEYMAHTGFEDSAKGNSRESARKNLRSSRNFIGHISADAGALYSQRIAPVVVWENRRYFINAKSTGNKMKFAHRAAQRGNWDQAKTYWSEVYKNAQSDKSAGKAAYNLAVASEAENQLQKAIDWTSIAYQDHGIKKAAAYRDILYHRLHQETRLNQQLETDTEVTQPE